MADNDKAVEEILDRLRERAQEGQVAVGDAMEALGGRSFGPFLFVPALVELTPVGAIPTVPTILATIIVIFSVQIVLGRDHLWLPGFLERLHVSGDRMRRATDKLQPLARWLDRWFHGRWERLASPWAQRVAAIFVILLCLTVPPLELVPFASSAPMSAIALFGLAMTFRDGALMAAGWALAVFGVGGVGIWVLGGGGGG